MSGIIAVINHDGTSVDRHILEQMCRRIAYLGPDQQSLLIEGSIGLGHTLFRTATDTQPEQQPVTFENVTLVADARVDGRDELIAYLRSANRPVARDSADSFLILQSYLAWGRECVRYLIGDYAFVLWDRRKAELFAARDRLGIRPLYYANSSSTVIVSNEIAPIRMHPSVSAEINEQAIADYLLFGGSTWIAKEQTAFKAIHRIPAGTLLCSTEQETCVQRFWTLSPDIPMLRYKTEDEYLDHFKTTFGLAVKDRIRSDRIAISMSGGIDSTAIAATACQLIKSGMVNAMIFAFTTVYNFVHPDHEAYYAGLAAKKLNIPIHFFDGDKYPLVPPLPIGAEPRDLLFANAYEDGNRRVRESASVALVGHGGDESFFETPLMQTLSGLPPLEALELYRWLWRFLGKRPSLGLAQVSSLPAFLTHRRKPDETLYGKYPVWLNPEFEAQLRLKERWQDFLDWRPSILYPHHRRAHHYLLFRDWVQRTERLKGLEFTGTENTSPFLDSRVIEFCMSLPPQPWLRNKYLLRQAMRGLLPEPILNRRKTPLGNVLGSLLQQPDTIWVDQWIPFQDTEKYIKRDAVPLLGNGAANGSRAFSNIRPLILDNWLRHRNDFA